MSTYTQITKHPQTGNYEVATHYDDYYGPHMYGVEFPSDKKVYPADLVERKQIYDFWYDDVVLAFQEMAYNLGAKMPDMPKHILGFLNEIQGQYRARWTRDPVGGEGAVDKSATLKKNQKQ